jgi:tetratricopeptide (TPR) repeat protein
LISSKRDQYKNDKKKWEAIFQKNGNSILHFHHYCEGLLMLSRLERGVGEPNGLLGNAEAQFKYMLTHLNPNHFMLPEVHTKMGITQKLMGRNNIAMNHFSKAVELNKRYIPAYIELINMYKMIGDSNSAVSIVRTGLKYSPDSKILKQKLLELE